MVRMLSSKVAMTPLLRLLRLLGPEESLGGHTCCATTPKMRRY